MLLKTQIVLCIAKKGDGPCFRVEFVDAAFKVIEVSVLFDINGHSFLFALFRLV